MVDPSSPSHQLVGAVLSGRFRIVRLLGEGGMGAVYEADGLRGEGKRAIKVLHPEFTQDEQVLQRFFAEAEATKGFVHQNIASVFEASRSPRTSTRATPSRRSRPCRSSTRCSRRSWRRTATR